MRNFTMTRKFSPTPQPEGTLHVHLPNGEVREATQRDLSAFGYADKHLVLDFWKNKVERAIEIPVDQSEFAPLFDLLEIALYQPDFEVGKPGALRGLLEDISDTFELISE